MLNPSTVKIKVGVFARTINAINKRGASRLFGALFNELIAHPDVELFLLGQHVPYELSPNDCLFYFDAVKDITITKNDKWRGQASVIDTFESLIFGLEKIYSAARRHYKRLLPRHLRSLLCLLTQPLNAMVSHSLEKGKGRVRYVRTSLLHGDLQSTHWFDVLKAAILAPTHKFSNANIPLEIMNLNQLDVVLNFWWLHLGEENPMNGVPLFANPLIYSWFLDAIPLRLPHWQMGLTSENDFRCLIQPLCNSSHRMVAISQSAGDDLNRLFGVPTEKIAVVPCGIFESDFTPPPATTPSRLAIDFSLPIIMVLGVQEPSKNTINILKAIELYIQRGHKDFQCVLVGAHEGFDPEDRFGHVIEAVERDVKITFLGAIEEDDKRRLMFGAHLLLYPSLWEGFGIPPLEAMAAGVPVIVSDIASLPAVCGGHAFYCDPYDPENIADKINQVFQLNPAEKAAHVAEARDYARQWIWSAKAIPTLIADMRGQLAAMRKDSP